MAGPISLVSADFEEIKQALKEYVESTGLFPGADFEGSNWSVIFDTLAYQAQLSAYSTNLIANESFLESAVIRRNVVSGAKQLGYVPVSARCSKTNIDFQFKLDESDYPSGFPVYVNLEPGMAFSTAGGKGNYIFNVVDEQVASVRNDGLCLFNNIEISEGVFLSDEFTVDDSNYDQRFIIENKNVDTTTLRVEVQEIPSEEARSFYSQADNLVALTKDSRKYFVEESDNGYYELVFGDGNFGYKPGNGAKIFVKYAVSSGALANGIQNVENYKFVGTLVDSYGARLNDQCTVTSVGPSQGGAEIESIASIKFRAPREHAAQNRCVIAEDYDTLVRRIFSPIDDVYVYGGETLRVPEYGRVYIVIKPKTGRKLSNITKNYIKKSLDPYRIASLDIRIVDPEILYVEVVTTAYYNELKTIKDTSSIRATITDALNKYIQSTAIPKFGGALRYSRIVGIIDDADKSITRNNTKLLMRKDLSIVPNTFATYKTDFKQEIDVQYDQTVVYSSGFKMELQGEIDQRVFYFENDPKTIRYETTEDQMQQRLVSDLYCFYFNEFNEKVRVSFYMNKFNELIVVDVLGDDQEATPFGVMSFNGEIELGYKFKNGINFHSTEETGNYIQIRAIPKEFDIFAEESVFLQLDVSRSNVNAIIDQKIAGS